MPEPADFAPHHISLVVDTFEPLPPEQERLLSPVRTLPRPVTLVYGAPTVRQQPHAQLARCGLVIAILAAVVGSLPRLVHADGTPIRIVVLKEHGVGSPALAQPYLDRFVAMAAEQNGWSDAKAQYCTSRSAAESYIETDKPQFGILSLAAFLALRVQYHLEVIGQVGVTLIGGRQYSLISKSNAELAGCKGKTLASDHTDDPRFIERVVSAGAFKLADFTLIQTQRPLQTIMKVLNGEAACALIDDAQLAELPHLEGGEALHTVWKSTELPPMAVVAFPKAAANERKHFQENLPKVCDDDGQSVCAEVGIVSLRATDGTDYARVVSAYGK